MSVIPALVIICFLSLFYPILDATFFVVCMIGVYLIYKVIGKADSETSKKLGYGPCRIRISGKGAPIIWPKEFYVDDVSIFGYGIIKKEYKNKVNAWYKESRRRIFSNNLLYIGALLLIIGFGGLIILWEIRTYNVPIWNTLEIYDRPIWNIRQTLDQTIESIRIRNGWDRFIK